MNSHLFQLCFVNWGTRAISVTVHHSISVRADFLHHLKETTEQKVEVQNNRQKFYISQYTFLNEWDACYVTNK